MQEATVVWMQGKPGKVVSMKLLDGVGEVSKGRGGKAHFQTCSCLARNSGKLEAWPWPNGGQCAEFDFVLCFSGILEVVLLSSLKLSLDQISVSGSSLIEFRNAVGSSAVGC